jgi:hypothetical protein
MAREITTHHDGHGLNEALRIVADEPGPGGASHSYAVSYQTRNTGSHVADVQFQKGPRDVEGSTPGVTDIALLAIVRDRLESFNAGDYRCRENAIALTHIEEAMMWMKERAHARAKRGVLGTYAK